MRSGEFQVIQSGGEPVRIFKPRDLPPDPPLSLSLDDLDLMEQANRALGRLDGLSSLLPDTSLFLYLYIRKEALLSSQIEGTQSSLSELLLSEHHAVPGVPEKDVTDVSNYVAAMNHGLERLTELPLSIRLIREIHGILLRDGRGAGLTPGEFRRTQNWIGGTRPGNAHYVPPPPDLVVPTMGALEKFVHDEPVRTPVLIKAALAHLQFESIHPFLDGNGRVGRLLITFLLCSERALQQPLLYLSLFFKRNRDEYYGLLQRVRTEGVWEEWVRFFLSGVYETATQAVDSARRIVDLFAEHHRQIEQVGQRAGSILRVHHQLQKQPVLDIPEAAEATGLSRPTVKSSFDEMQKLGIAREVTGRRRDRAYVYSPFIQLLNEGTEPPGQA